MSGEKTRDEGITSNTYKQPLSMDRPNLEKTLPSILVDAALQNQYERIIDYANELISFSDKHLKCKYINKYGKKLLGFDENDDLTGVDIRRFHPEEQWSVFLKLFPEYFKDNDVWRGETRLKTKNGSILHVYQIVIAIKEKDEITHYGTIIYDLSTIRNITTVLKQQQAYLSKVIDAIPSALYIKDRHGRILMCNKAASSIFNKSPGELIGKRFEDIPDINASKFIEQDSQGDREVFTKRKTVVIPELQFTIDSSNSQQPWYQIVKTPILDEDNVSLNVLSIATDITSRKRVEESLKSQLKLEEIIAHISNSFINIQYEDFDSAIYNGLQLIGQAVGVDRALIYLLNDGVLVKKYGWFSDEKDPTKDKSYAFQLEDYPWFLEEVERNGFSYIPSISVVPLHAKKERELFKLLHLKSWVTIPMKSGNELKGYLVLSQYRSERQFSSDSISMLIIASQVFLNALERKETHRRLQLKYNFENLLVNISTKILSTKPADLAKAIRSALKEFSSFLSIENAILLSRDINSQYDIISYYSRDFSKSYFKDTLLSGLLELIIRKHDQSRIVQLNLTQDVASLTGEGGCRLSDSGIRSVISIAQKDDRAVKDILLFVSKKEKIEIIDELKQVLLLAIQILCDAIEKKKSEESLMEIEEMYRTLARNIPNAVVLLFDRELRYRVVEGADLENQGYIKELVEGRKLEEVMATPNRKIFEPLYKKALKGEHIMFEAPFNERHYLIHILPVRNEKGEIYAGLFMSQDITSLKEIQRELIQRANELDRSNKDLEMFAYAASHDLREPLRMIGSYVQMLEKKLSPMLDDQTREFMYYVVDGVNRMQEMIDDLLEYSRVDRKGKAFERVDMNEVVQIAMHNLKKSIEETAAIITTDPLPVVTGEKRQLVSLIQNLISNAIKFRKDQPPVIKIGVKELDTEWRFYVRDNGIGIEEKYYERIFALFQRLQSRKEYSGSGIGLAICKKIITRHQGKIWVKSKPGEGSTFYFTLPKKNANPES